MFRSRDGAAGVRRAQRCAGHVPPDQRRVHHPSVDGVGGLARVATLKKTLADAGRTPFLVIAGDFLSPSVASSVFKGEHMIAALNAAGLDLATLGNHELDFGDDVLIQRMHEAAFQWRRSASKRKPTAAHATRAATRS